MMKAAQEFTLQRILHIPTPTQQATAITILFAFTTFGLAAVLMRTWTRIRVIKKWYIEDSLLVTAEVFSLIMCPTFLFFIKLAYFGWEDQDIPDDFDPSFSFPWLFGLEILYNPILALVKCSVLACILRIGEQKRAVYYICKGLIIFTGLQAAAALLTIVFQCMPIAASWDLAARADAKCISNGFHIALSSITILSDALVIWLPFYVFAGLQIKRTTKIALLSTFTVCSIVTIISIYRIVCLVELVYFPQMIEDRFHDIRMIITAVEVNTAVAFACAPALRPFLRHHFPGLFRRYEERLATEPHDTRQQRAVDDDWEIESPPRPGSSIVESIYLDSLRSLNPPSSRLEIRISSFMGSGNVVVAPNAILRTTEIKIDYEDA